MRQAGLFGLSDHLKRLSDYGDPLEELAWIVDFEVFRPALVGALAYSDGARGGRPPYDADSDDRAHVFRSDAAQRSDLIARSLST